MNKKSIDEINMIYPDVKIEEVQDNDYIKIIISEEINIMTPGLNLVLGNPYKIQIERNIPNET